MPLKCGHQLLCDPDAARARLRTEHPNLDAAFTHAIALTDLGRMRQQTGDYPGAGGAYTGALEVYPEIGHRDGEATVLFELGRVRESAGDYSGASDALTRALEINCAIGNRHGEARVIVLSCAG